MKLSRRERRLVKGLQDVEAFLTQAPDIPNAITYVALGKVRLLLTPYLRPNRACKRRDCKKQFTPKRKDQVFCSQACAHLDSVRRQRAQGSSLKSLLKEEGIYEEVQDKAVKKLRKLKEKNEKGHHA